MVGWYEENLQMNQKLLRDCLKVSLNRISNHPQRSHYIHFSFAIVDNKIACVGTNKSATPDIHFGYNMRVEEPKVHSELDVYRKLRKKVRINRTEWSLINVRLNRSGEMKISKPCSVCHALLTDLGCKEIYYTTNGGWGNVSL